MLRFKPYILLVHDIYPDIAIRLNVIKAGSPVAWIWERVSRFFARGAAASVVLGRDMAEVMRKKLRPDQFDDMAVIPLWSGASLAVPLEKSKNPFRSRHAPAGAFYVQYSGTMARIHNVEPIIDAAEILAGENVFFQFVGDGAKRAKLKELVSRRKLGNVQFLPFQPVEELAVALSAPDLAIACLSSEITGFSVPSKSYGILAAGVPLLALMDAESEIGLMVKETEAGVVLPNATGASIAAAVRELRADEPTLARMSANGRKAFKENYTLDKSAAKYEHLMRNAFRRNI
jgi:glycosyltransferase involved in cell wall biosynthesis